MKILAIAPSTRGGGSERQALQRYRRLSSYGVTVEILALDAEGPLSEEYRKAGIPVHTRRSLLQLIRRLRRGEFAVVETYGQRAHLLGVLAHRLLQRRLAVICPKTSTDTHWSKRRRSIERWASRFTTVHVSNSKAGRQALLDNRISPEQIRLIPNGLDLSRFFQGKERKEIRREVRESLAIPEASYTLLSVGNFRPVKAHHILLRAFNELTGSIPDAVLLLSGTGRTEAEIRSLGRSLGIDSNIRFLGWRGDVPALLCSCDVFVLSSLREGMPNAVMEAMAAGVSVVATEVGGIPELIRNRFSGLLVPPGESAPLAKALLELATDPQMRSKLAKNALQEAQRLSLDTHLRSWLTLYTSLQVHDATMSKAGEHRFL